MQATIKYSKGDGTVTVESIYHLKRATIPRQGFADVKKYRDELDKRTELYIVLKKITNVAPKQKPGSRINKNQIVKSNDYLRRMRMRRGV